MMARNMLVLIRQLTTKRTENELEMEIEQQLWQAFGKDEPVRRFVHQRCRRMYHHLAKQKGNQEHCQHIRLGNRPGNSPVNG
jgi:hypothetical protein